LLRWRTGCANGSRKSTKIQLNPAMDKSAP
jgi:hypothetical protein